MRGMIRVSAERQIRYARLLALVFCLGGGITIFLGWSGAAKQATGDAQLPYLLSGGAAGIGLLAFGIGLLMLAQIRAERRSISRVLDLMGETLSTQARDSLARAAAERGGQEDEPFALPVRAARAVALGLAAAGFVVIFLGWNGMARAPFADEQLPYVVSGGFGGMGLILLGIAIMLIAQMRTERRRLMDVLEVMAVAVSHATLGGWEVPTGNGEAKNLVVAGPSTYHRQDCRLIQGKEGLHRLTISGAKSSGLSPCRVCDPDRVEEEPAIIEDGEPAKV